ncbi:hypothetical protein MCOR21_005876 [Pyricularia oryzae]|nr:hypothetical protein MCOR26_004831 [Pyricularia oryzae]KAI6349717.1 hypothetical protein MCOR28_000777 [Pyricularia oryzae]KAI6427870.1 hypothetical protein MCOR21_005876 [Pyricularia oryzae]KAI6503993.1 hypothetical protein MCOR11_000461 [Pyricularia oryzae]
MAYLPPVPAGMQAAVSPARNPRLAWGSVYSVFDLIRLRRHAHMQGLTAEGVRWCAFPGGCRTFDLINAVVGEVWDQALRAGSEVGELFLNVQRRDEEVGSDR